MQWVEDVAQRKGCREVTRLTQENQKKEYPTLEETGEESIVCVLANSEGNEEINVFLEEASQPTKQEYLDVRGYYSQPRLLVCIRYLQHRTTTVLVFINTKSKTTTHNSNLPRLWLLSCRLLPQLVRSANHLLQPIYQHNYTSIR